MSILNGKIHSSVIQPTVTPFGPSLQPAVSLSLPGCADVALDDSGSIAFAACRGSLAVYDLSDPARPELLAKLDGLGASRQMVVRDGYAYITARADGLYIIDVHNPRQLQLAAHYDTVELATGIAVENALCLVACRHLGIEVLDVADPSHPRSVSTFLAGEAQSVHLDDHFAYVGDWMNRTVHIFNLIQPENPIKTAEFLVDGYADGVDVRDGYCYVATGHHDARLKNRLKYRHYPFVTPEMLQDGYGCGHGLEIFDVTDPSAPEFVSGIKLPPLYEGGNDTWRVQAAGHYAYVTDTYNGFFVLDVQNPYQPRFAGFLRLPRLETASRLSPPTIQQLCHPVTGVALLTGHILLASVTSGLHVVPFPAALPATTRLKHPVMPVANTAWSMIAGGLQPAFQCPGQIHTIAFDRGIAFAACGNAGLFALNAAAPAEVLGHCETVGIAHDIQVLDGLLYVAEGQEGLTVYRFSPQAGFCRLGCRQPEPDRTASAWSVRQVVPLPAHRLIALELGSSAVGWAAVLPDGLPGPITITPVPGVLYHRHLCREPLGSDYLAALPLSSSPLWFDLSGGQPRPTDWPGGSEACPIEDGAAVAGDALVVIHQRHYAAYRSAAAARRLDPDAWQAVPGARLNGQPFVCGHTLVLLNRCLGTAECLDLADIDRPRLVRSLRLPGQPEYAVGYQGLIWVACGHAGLFILPVGDDG